MGQGLQPARALLAVRGLRLRRRQPAPAARQDPFEKLLVKARGSVLVGEQEIFKAAE